MKLVIVKFCLVLILLGLFVYQSTRTIMKYQAGKTSLQVNLTEVNTKGGENFIRRGKVWTCPLSRGGGPGTDLK